MFLADCPNCRKPILIPGNHMKAVAQCPLCEYEFSVEGIASTEVPVVEILRSDFSTIDGAKTKAKNSELNFDLEPSEKSSDSEGARNFKDDAPRPDFDFDDEGTQSAELATLTQAVPSPFDGVGGRIETSERTSVAAERRMQPRQGRSPLVEVIKIIGGGVVGLAIAQAILWWLPGDWRRDPLGLAPKVPEFAAFIVPAELRKSGETSQQNPAPDPNDYSTASYDDGSVEIEPLIDPEDIDLGNVGLNSDDLTESENPTDVEIDPDEIVSSSDEISDALDANPTNASSVDSNIEVIDHQQDQPNTIDDVATSDSESDDAPAEGDASTGEDSIVLTGDDDPELEPTPEHAVVEARLAHAPTISLDQLTEALTTANALSTALSDSGNTSKSKSARREFYVRIAELGRAVTYFDGDFSEIEQQAQVEALLREIGQDEFKFNLIGASVAGWLTFSGRETDGVVIAGYPREITEIGSVFATKIELAGRPDRFMNVLSKNDPRTHEQMPVEIGKPVVVLGIISDKPSEQIIGYDGAATIVIWHGTHVTVPSSD
ncbi:MAG: hypothetical protein KDB27_19895 [Planctomycetales bacterium]|nr:hypothetical protein [Planctomycetales bacterium]